MSAECGDPGQLLLGSRQVLGTTEGSVVTYSCNSGFRLVGDSQRTCLATGEWSGNPPFCNSKAQTGTCMYVGDNVTCYSMVAKDLGLVYVSWIVLQYNKALKAIIKSSAITFCFVKFCKRISV